MPWNEESVMSQRMRMIEQLLLPNVNVSKVCESFNISRKTAYKWLRRYTESGINGLKDISKEPHSQPYKVSMEFEDLVIEIHKESPSWGPRKLRDYFLHIEEMQDVPSHTTFSRILERNNCRVINNTKSKPANIRYERDEPNDLWQMDFKGSFMTDINRCYPLTILDDCSRFSLDLKACENESGMTVQSHLTSIFREFGLPNQINVDNGNPWGSSDLNSTTSIQVWLLKLGIRLSHSSAYHPQTNGKIERFHRTLKLEVLHDRKYKNIKDVQSSFDEWRHKYNNKRPHDALGGKTPGSRYKISPKKIPNKLPKPEYESDCIVRKVSQRGGLIRFKGNRYLVGKGFGGEYIAVKETNNSDEFAVFFMDHFIKKLKLQRTV